MAPPQRRGGGGGEGRGGGAGKSGGRGGGGRGPRGGGRGPRGGAGANADASAAPGTPPSAAEGGAASGGTRSASKPKPARKARASDAIRNGGGGGAPAGRPARAVSIVTRKVLIRNIPHDWDEDKLIELIETHGATREHVWRFVAGKVRSNNRAPRPGRLYLDFKRDAALAKSVIEKLHGLPVPDSKDEATLEVEFAPFQKIPREKQRKDPKVGTIDRDPDFVAFLEALSKPKEKLPSADVAAELKDTDGITDKPVAALVQFLNERKREKKGKFSGKATEKARGTRVKPAKDGKGAKDKSKSTKGGKGKASEASTTKDTSKPRKSRGKLAKEKAAETELVEPGAIKIMGVKPRDSSLTRTEIKPAATPDATSSDTTAGPPPKAKTAGGKGGGSKARSRSAQAKEPSSQSTETAPPSEASAGPRESGGSKPSGRGRRDSRASKGPKGGGRGDQPKKVFVPKATTPAG